MRRRSGWRFLLAGLLFAVTALLLFAWHAARWLNVPDPPAKADVIVVLAGRYERAMHAADLYRQGLAPRVALSEVVPDPSAARLEALGIRLASPLEVQRRILAAKGVPESAIEVLPGQSLSTADEAERIAARYGKAGARVLTVTSPSHVRRARMIVADALEGRGAALAVCATPEAFPDAWWRSQDAAREVLLEWAKIAFWLGGGRYRAAPRSKCAPATAMAPGCLLPYPALIEPPAIRRSPHEVSTVLRSTR